MIISTTRNFIRDHGGFGLGSWIEFPVDLSKKYAVNSHIVGARYEQIFENKSSEKLFQFLGEANEMLRFAGELTEFFVEFGGEIGYKSGVRVQHEICMTLYGLPRHGIMCYSMGEKEAENIILRREQVKNWIAEEYLEWEDDSCSLGLQYYDRGSLSAEYFVRPNHDYERHAYPLRPILCIPRDNPQIKVKYDGKRKGVTKETAIKILVD